MTKVVYPKTSPYYSTPQSSWLIGRYRHRRIPVRDDDQYITLEAKHHLKPENLSQELYGSPQYWWVFAVCNTNLIRDPIWDFEVGMTIRAPSLASIRTNIG